MRQSRAEIRHDGAGISTDIAVVIIRIRRTNVIRVSPLVIQAKVVPDLVLDGAAGNGNASLALARRFCRVTSTDFVPAMPEKGRARAMAEDLGLSADPLDCDMGAPAAEKPARLQDLSTDPWRSNGDTIERLELLAQRLVRDGGWGGVRASEPGARAVESDSRSQLIGQPRDHNIGSGNRRKSRKAGYFGVFWVFFLFNLGQTFFFICFTDFLGFFPMSGVGIKIKIKYVLPGLFVLLCSHTVPAVSFLSKNIYF